MGMWTLQPTAESHAMHCFCALGAVDLQSNDIAHGLRPAYDLHHVYSCNTIVIVCILADGVDASFARCSPGGDHIPASSSTGVAVLWRVDLYI